MTTVKCRTCASSFETDVYREKFCSPECKLLYRVNRQAPGGCWEWGRSFANSGYGVLNVNQKIVLAHRLSYEYFVSPIPDGHFICHRCDNRSCINPNHLFSGLHADNMRDMAQKGRAAWRGKKRPQETIEKIKLARRGRKISRDHLVALQQGLTAHRARKKVEREVCES